MTNVDGHSARTILIPPAFGIAGCHALARWLHKHPSFRGTLWEASIAEDITRTLTYQALGTSQVTPTWIW